MRRLLIGDLLAAARVLAPVAPAGRGRVMDRLLREAHAAHLYAKRFGRDHPLWGNGSLMARALREPAADLASARLQLALLGLVIDRLQHWRS